MHADEIEELGRRAAQGEEAAMETLLSRHLPGLRAFVRLRTGPALRRHESSSDIVQSVCREVLQHQERFQHDGESAFKRWLYSTALRKISNKAEFYQARKRAAGDREDVELYEQYKSFSTPSRRAMIKEEVERVESAFEQLTEEQREVITLAHVVGLSRAEIAAAMGKTEGTVRVTLHRALARVSALLCDDE